MTQLFIDGQEAVLPENFSCKSVSENPLFTKSGDYTLDITLSLENPVNAKIYKHVNRINSLSRFENRTAILVSDNEVVIKGKEVLLKFSNKEVGIQIVAGNSSLNYLIGNDLNVRSLDLGTAVINKNQIISNLSKDYPEVDFQLLPFFDPDNNFLGNRYTYEKDSSGRLNLKYAYDGTPVATLDFYYDINPYQILKGDWSGFITVYENYRPQPYLGAIIRKMFNALGYSLQNDIDGHDFYKYLYIVHAHDTLEFAKMLPDWTVVKFLEEVENLFDCTVVADNNTMEARIIFNHNFYNGQSDNNVIMLDDFDATVEEGSEKMQYEKNIAYNLPDTDYYRYQNLPVGIMENLRIISYQYDTDRETVERIATAYGSYTPDILRMTDRTMRKSLSLQFIEYMQDDKVSAKAVNDYVPLKNNPDSESNDIQLDIIPAEFVVKPYYIRDRISFSKDAYMMLQMPVAKCDEAPVILFSEDDGEIRHPLVQEYIEGGESVPENNSDEQSISPLQIAFYNSQQRWGHNEGATVWEGYDTMPVSYVRSISESAKLADKLFYYFQSFKGRYANPLSLQFLHEEIYSKNEKIDRSKVYKIRFLKPVRKLDPKQIFIIGNRKFYCRKFERTITIDGFDEIIYGEFYAEKD